MAYWYDGAALAATGSPVIALFWCLIKFTTTTTTTTFSQCQCCCLTFVSIIFQIKLDSVRCLCYTEIKSVQIQHKFRKICENETAFCWNAFYDKMLLMFSWFVDVQ